MSSRLNCQEEQHKDTPAASKTRNSCPEVLMGVGAWTGEAVNKPSPPLQHRDSQILAPASKSNIAALEKAVPKYDAVAQFCAEAPRESAQSVAQRSTDNSIGTFNVPANKVPMLRIFRARLALRPLAGIGTCYTSLRHYRRPVFAPRWFSQSSTLRVQSNHHARGLDGFINHYAILGVNNTATQEDIESAFQWLCGTFDPEVMRNVDNPEYEDDPDLDEFIKWRLSNKIKESYEILVEPTKREAYDEVYNDLVQTVQQSEAGRGDNEQFYSEMAIASRLRLDRPTTHWDGTPIRDHCVVRVCGLPPEVRPVDLVEAIAEHGPVGRLIDCRIHPPLEDTDLRCSAVEFDNDVLARQFALLFHDRDFFVLGKHIPAWYITLLQPLQMDEIAAPHKASRVLIIEGPKDHEIMNWIGLKKCFKPRIKGFRPRLQSFTLTEIEGSELARIELVFTSWRRGAQYAEGLVKRKYPELSATYGRDPFETDDQYNARLEAAAANSEDEEASF